MCDTNPPELKDNRLIINEQFPVEDESIDKDDSNDKSHLNRYERSSPSFFKILMVIFFRFLTTGNCFKVLTAFLYIGTLTTE